MICGVGVDLLTYHVAKITEKLNEIETILVLERGGGLDPPLISYTGVIQFKIHCQSFLLEFMGFEEKIQNPR